MPIGHYDGRDGLEKAARMVRTHDAQPILQPGKEGLRVICTTFFEYYHQALGLGNGEHVIGRTKLSTNEIRQEIKVDGTIELPALIHLERQEQE